MLWGALAGIAYGGVTGLAFMGTAWPHVLIGAFNGGMIAATIGATEIFVARTAWGRTISMAPFLVTFGVKWALYGLVITIVNTGGITEWLFGYRSLPSAVSRSYLLLSTVFSFVATFGFLFMFEISRIVGPRTLRNIVLGRYHRPRVEERFFLFVDIAGSTSLAERIGPAAVHRFLDAVFRAASDPIRDHRGEIYQYVGDEMVVTWTVAEGRVDARPIACFFAIVAALEDARPVFEREFAVSPRLRAALHAGPVITGEIGDFKRDIVFHGDVMNTAARLEQATRQLDRNFLVSADAVARLSAIERYTRESLGPQALRGRATPVDVYAITGADASPLPVVR